MNLKLSLALTPYDRNLPLITGEVKPDGIDLEYAGMPGSVPRVFYEQIKFQRYDISEMSLSSFLRMRAIGFPYRMLPVFHNRTYSYSFIHIRQGSGIRQGHPEDLKGKRIGVNDYQQTLAVWTRGVLQSEFGVKPEDMTWFQERGRHFSHTGASAEAGLKPPSRVTINYAKNDFGTMFMNGELDATCGLGFGLSKGRISGIDRAHAAVDETGIVPLFPDPRAEAIRYFKKTGIFPPHHTTVVRESLLDEHPWAALSLFEAFQESKRLAMERINQQPPSLFIFGEQYLRELAEVFGPDPYQYGVNANAKAVDALQTFSVEQELTEKKQPFEELYPQEILYLEERD